MNYLHCDQAGARRWLLQRRSAPVWSQLLAPRSITEERARQLQLEIDIWQQKNKTWVDKEGAVQLHIQVDMDKDQDKGEGTDKDKGEREDKEMEKGQGQGKRTMKEPRNRIKDMEPGKGKSGITTRTFRRKRIGVVYVGTAYLN